MNDTRMDRIELSEMHFGYRNAIRFIFLSLHNIRYFETMSFFNALKHFTMNLHGTI